MYYVLCIMYYVLCIMYYVLYIMLNIRLMIIFNKYDYYINVHDII
jgi:hypothetical protein